MKKILYVLFIGSTLSLYNMQHVGQSAIKKPSIGAMAPLATPILKEAKRTITKFQAGKPDAHGEIPYKIRLAYTPFILEQGKLTPDPRTKQDLQFKYPHIHVPDIYKSQSKLLTAAAGLTRIYHNPDAFSDPTEHEFVMLHELGHIRHYYSRLFMHKLKQSIRPTIILAMCFKLISIKYGVIGLLFGRKLFWNCYMRFYEEPSADNFAIKQAINKDILKGGRNFFAKNITFEGLLFDHDHPNMIGRTHKVKRALDKKTNYFRIAKIILILSIITDIIQLIYKYHKDKTTIIEGLKKLQEIEDNFEQYCDKFEIPKEGRPAWKYVLSVAQNYFQTKLEMLQQRKQPTEQEVIEQIIIPDQPHSKINTKE